MRAKDKTLSDTTKSIEPAVLHALQNVRHLTVRASLRVVENKRLDDMLSIVAELQAGRQQQRSKSGPRRTGQTDHMFGIRDGSQSNGYQQRGTKPGRKTDSTKDPVVIARRRQVLASQRVAE